MINNFLLLLLLFYTNIFIRSLNLSSLLSDIFCLRYFLFFDTLYVLPGGYYFM